MKKGDHNQRFNLFLAGLIIVGFVVFSMFHIFENIGTTGNPIFSNPDERSILLDNDSIGINEGEGIGMANPAAVYCKEMGYKQKNIKTEFGERGFCVFPDESECDQWDFLNGRCGQKYSYCVKQGYDIITTSEGKDPFSKEHAVCINKNTKQKIDSVTNLIKLSEKATISSQKAVENNPLSVKPLVEKDGNFAQGSETLPDYFDWRDVNGTNWITPVKDQEDCGSCWAFAAVGVAEAAFNIGQNNPDLDLDLSEQQLVSGCWGGTGGTCKGGWYDYALSYIKNKGSVDECCMSYRGVDNYGCKDDNSCEYTPITCDNAYLCSDSSSRNFKLTTTKQENVGTVYLREHGPFAAAMGIQSDYGGHFDENCVYRCDNDNGINHAVVIVGYNGTGNYWIVKNSWGYDDEDLKCNTAGYFKLGWNECDLQRTAIASFEGITTFKDIGLNEFSVTDVNGNPITEIILGQEVILKGNVGNIGGENLPNSSIGFDIVGNDEFLGMNYLIYEHLSNVKINPLNLGQIAEGIYIWDVPSYDLYDSVEIMGKADSCTQLIESNEINNKMSVAIPMVHSFCGDGICNGFEGCRDYVSGWVFKEACAEDCACTGQNNFCNDYGLCEIRICSDSDGGVNYFVKGTRIVGDGSISPPIFYSDACVTTSVLKEYSCNFENQGVSETVSCPAGCLNGACKKPVQGCYTDPKTKKKVCPGKPVA